MTVVHDEATGPLGLTDAEYLHWNPEDSPVSVHMHLDAVDGIVRDVIEGFESLPRRGLEVGGLLLGRVQPGDKTTVRIEQYQRVACEHKFGPQFLLDTADQLELEKSAGAILAGGELSVVGLYRSHTREGFQLEVADFELIRRYFSDASDLILLIKPESLTRIFARFYVHDSNGGARPAGEAFPFRGRVLIGEPRRPGIIESTLEEKPEPKPPEAKPQDPPMPEPPLPEMARERPRRLVPDFAPSPGVSPEGEPSHPAEPPAAPLLFAPRERIFDYEDEPSAGKPILKWAAIVAGLLLAGGGLWWLLQPGHHSLPIPAPVASTEPARPLGLSVEPMGPTGKEWRVSWNPNATALHDARTVQLFVRDGDDQNRIDLSASDLASGVYRYQPMGHDVTFRLEVTDSSGRISAESFRLEQNQATVAPAAPKPAAQAEPTPGPRPTPTVIHRTEPKAIHRAPPVIAAGIRPRINGTIPIDVRVHVDERGRVTSAAPVRKPQGGLNTYLADAAVKAARQWRFEPARDNGKPVPGVQVIHFVFER